ncbi:hypothetical protein FVEG_11208 [Fusarium verticillioides 7600]|uniref:DUF6546 domain-containing protein n=1 Tax=Gibberella moniliformis (strain M3125 / FGSC 7600) TaxID=334819 RepID=W7MN38_GIBM7|nr:hypothetical protein FVEG_11208 [Fusarium verticillioides 7600]EWG52466.1 hypothetical protein FVEG_11208 [Fusarium verticillioides 7600]
MDRLSTELLSMIAAEAAACGPQIDINTVFDVWDSNDTLKTPRTLSRHNSLAPYAAVSHNWQLAFEPFTFHTLVISPKRLIEAAQHGYLTERRLGYVRFIAVLIAFPLPRPWDTPIIFPPGLDVRGDFLRARDDAGYVSSEDEFEEHEGDGDGDYVTSVIDFPHPRDRGYDRVFAKIMRILFNALKLAPVHENQEPYIDIRFGFPIPREFGLSRISSPEEMEANTLEGPWLTTIYFDMNHNGEELPELPSIASCSFELVSWSLCFEPHTACIFASKMPHLKKLKLHLSDRELKDPGLRIDMRKKLASSLSILPRGIYDFNFHYSRGIPRDHAHIPASILDPDENCDHLSQALFNFSQRENITRFSAEGSFELSVMGPSEEALSSCPGWSKLETYKIGFLAIAPTGKWLAVPYKDGPNTDIFKTKRWGPPSGRPRGYYSNFNVNEFRGPIDPDYAHELLCAAGQAASHMPRLQRMVINVGVIGSYRVSYNSAKVEPCMRIVGKKLQPPEEDMLRIWRRVAREHDHKLVLRWKDTARIKTRIEDFE